MKRAWILLLLAWLGLAQQVSGQDLEKVLERAETLLEEAKTGYEEARSKGSVEAFVDAGFKLEEARLKFIVLQEIGAPDKQKLAADRLRAINQLGKLIHDGKVAISGTPAESAKAPDAPAAPPAPADPAPAPALKAADVTKRAQVPEAKKLQEAEKLLRHLFKEQYSRKTPADRKALGRELLQQVPKNQDDLAAVWVLCREAQDAALQGGDLKGALAAVEVAASLFDVDGAAMKSAALATASKTAKTPEEFGALAAALLKSVDEFVAADQYDPAEKTMTAALAHAKKAADPTLVVRVATRAKEVAECKALFTSMKSVMETLAKTPDHPGSNLEIGKFLCFAKGNWDLGLRFILKGSDADLKALAEKENAFPSTPVERSAIADGWSDLAEKEKSGFRKSQMQAHARSHYEAALPAATGLLRARIEKRLSELSSKLSQSSAAGVPSIDLIAPMDPKKDAFAGVWERAGTRINIVSGGFARIEIPYEPPDEYDLKMVIESPAGADTETVLLLTHKGHAFALSIYPSRGNGAIYYSGAPVRFGTPITAEKPFTVSVQMRNDSFKAIMEEKTILEWKPDWSTVGPHVAWNPRNPKVLGFGVNGAKISLVSAQLVEVTGRGKKLR